MLPVHKTAVLFLGLISILNVSAISNTDFVLNVALTQPNTKVFLPLGIEIVPTPPMSISVDWGDSFNEIYTSATFESSMETIAINHTYAFAGNVTIAISRSGPGPLWLTQFGWNPLGTAGWSSMANVVLLNVSSFGDLGITSLRGCFYKTSYDFSVPTDIPSTVTDLSHVFYQATAFNQPISSWNTIGVNLMNNMFYQATAFNQSIDSWNVSAVTDMSYMFRSATAFNQPIDSWDVSSVRDMQVMFGSASNFNQPIGSWRVSSVLNMNGMFAQASRFNQSIGSWDVSSVQNMDSMFSYASDFNQPIDSWNVGSVTTIAMMFRNSIFNQPIGSWNVSSVTNMNSMFATAVDFNQPIGSWDVSKVTDMSYMFSFADTFNQPIGSWNVSSVNNMIYMFNFASAFNQTLKYWCVPSIPSRPFSFAASSQLSLEEEPIWGTCPQAVPVSSPENAPESAPQAAPAPPPETTPISAPEAAPTSPPQTLHSACPDPIPQGNVSCVDGRWVIYANSTFLSANQTIELAQNTTIVLTDPVEAQNVTIIVPLQGPTVTTAGRLVVQNCVALQGTVTIAVANNTDVNNGDKIELISSSRPDCFNVTVTTAVENENTDPCAPIVTAAPSIESQSTSKTLAVVLSVATSTQTEGACAVPSADSSSSELLLPVGSIAGIVVGCIVMAVAVAVGVKCYTKQRYARELKQTRLHLRSRNL